MMQRMYCHTTFITVHAEYTANEACGSVCVLPHHTRCCLFLAKQQAGSTADMAERGAAACGIMCTTTYSGAFS